MTDIEERLELQGQIDGLKIIVSSLLHALPDKKPFAFRVRELKGVTVAERRDRFIARSDL